MNDLLQGYTNVYAYDVESFPNCFSVVFKEVGQSNVFVALAHADDIPDTIYETILSKSDNLMNFKTFFFPTSKKSVRFIWTHSDV